MKLCEARYFYNFFGDELEKHFKKEIILPSYKIRAYEEFIDAFINGREKEAEKK